MQKKTLMGCLLNEGSIAYLPLLTTLLAILQMPWEPSLWDVTDSFVLLACASLAALRTLLQWLLTCMNFTFDSEDLFCWYKRKKRFLGAMAGAKAAENYGDVWDLTWYWRWGIYTSIPTWTQSFPYENHCECYKKLTSSSWPMLFTPTDFFSFTYTLLSCGKIKSCCDCCFP